MNLLEKIIQIDKELLIFFNTLGNENWDNFWLTITGKFTWIPLYLIILYLIIKFYGWKKSLFILFVVAILVTFTDQFVNLIKETFERLRPNRDETIKLYIRVLKNSGGYSFFSGHAANSFAVSTFIILTLKNHFKAIYFILIWPFLFAYSRVYLGVHYPFDIICGSIVGTLIGFIFFKMNIIFIRYQK